MQNTSVSYWAARSGHYLRKDLITFSYTTIFAHVGGCPMLKLWQVRFGEVPLRTP